MTKKDNPLLLTDYYQNDSNLCMKGTIKTKEMCPKCKGKFQGNPLHCPTCLTTPRRYYIDIYWEKQHKIYKDPRGQIFDSYERASRLLTAIRHEIDQRTFDPSKYVSADLKDFRFETRANEWYENKLKEVEKGNLAESYTQKLKCYVEQYYLPYFKGIDVRDIRAYHVEKFYAQLPTKSLKYIKNIMSALENLFNTLIRYEYIEKKMIFPAIKLDSKPPKWVNSETQTKILEALPQEDKPIFAFLAFQGVRPGEARAVKVKDINFADGIITVSRTYSNRKIRERVKSKVVRPRLINPALIPILKELCKDKHPEAFIFINPRTGQSYSEDTLYRIWDSTRKKINIDITLYQATRHSLASIALNNGAPLTAIQGVLGHTDYRTTLKYAHPDVKSQEKVFQKPTKILSIQPQYSPSEKIVKKL